MRLRVAVLAVLLATGCVPDQARTEPNAAELRLLAYLARDPSVVIHRTERDADGHLLVITHQGATTRRYLIAPDDPAKPELRLRPLLDDSILLTEPNPHPGGGPPPRWE